MNNIIKVVIFVMILILCLTYMYSDTEYFKADCANCGYNDVDLCMNCSNCGVCITGSGEKTCVPGMKNGPVFRSDCKDWIHKSQIDHTDRLKQYDSQVNNDYDDLMKRYYELENLYDTELANEDSCYSCETKTLDSCNMCETCGICTKDNGSKKCMRGNDNGFIFFIFRFFIFALFFLSFVSVLY